MTEEQEKAFDGWWSDPATAGQVATHEVCFVGGWEAHEKSVEQEDEMQRHRDVADEIVAPAPPPADTTTLHGSGD